MISSSSTAYLNSTATATSTTSVIPVQDADIDPFQAIATGPPPSQIISKGPHPVPTLNIVGVLLLRHESD